MVFGNGNGKGAFGHFLSAFAGLAEAASSRKPGARRVPGTAGQARKRDGSCNCGGARRAAMPGLRRPPR